MSLAALEALIAGVKVRCEVVERDRHGRQGLLARWVDSGRRWVSAGWAVAYRRYSKDYVDAEDEAFNKSMATDPLIAPDAVIGQAAFDHVRGMQTRDLVLSHSYSAVMSGDLARRAQTR